MPCWGHLNPVRNVPKSAQRPSGLKVYKKERGGKLRTLAESETCCSVMATTCSLSALFNTSYEQFNLRLKGSQCEHGADIPWKLETMCGNRYGLFLMMASKELKWFQNKIGPTQYVTLVSKQWSGRTDNWLQINRLSLRMNWLKFETLGELLTTLEEFIEYASLI